MTNDQADTASRMHPAPLVHAVKMFMATGGQTVDQFNAAQACFYLGMQFEELAEKIEHVAGGVVSNERLLPLVNLATFLRLASDDFKSGKYQGEILRADHAQLIDADFDLAWVSLGALLSTSLNAEGAISHGTFTNLDKMRDGVVFKDANGKILKPEGWRPPDFTPFVDPTPRED